MQKHMLYLKKNCKTSMAVTSHYRILKMFFNINNGLYGEFFLKIKLLVLFQFNTGTIKIPISAD